MSGQKMEFDESVVTVFYWTVLLVVSILSGVTLTWLVWVSGFFSSLSGWGAVSVWSMIFGTQFMLSAACFDAVFGALRTASPKFPRRLAVVAMAVADIWVVSNLHLATVRVLGRTDPEAVVAGTVPIGDSAIWIPVGLMVEDALEAFRQRLVPLPDTAVVSNDDELEGP